MARSGAKDMTVGSPLRLIVSFALPLILGNLFQQMYNMVDAIIVGKYLGPGALAAVGSVGALQFLIIGFCLGSCSGMSIPIAQRFGAKDEKNLRLNVANCVWVCLIMAVVVTTVTSILCRKILIWMNTPADIMENTVAYFSVILMGIPAMILYNMASAMMRALGDSQRPLYFLILSSLLNIGLDLLFVINFHMGVAGAAWATILSQFISGILCVVYIRARMPLLHVRKEEGEWKLSPSHCKNLVSIGMPMGLQFSITAIGGVVLSKAVNTLGTVYVASNTAAQKVQMMFNCVYDAFGTTMATYTGQNLGAQKVHRISKGVRISLIITVSYSILTFFILSNFGPTIALLFLDKGETAILANVKTFLTMNSMFFFSLAILMITRNTIQGLGYSKSALFAGIFEMFARGIIAFTLVPVYGYIAACLANPAAWIAGDLFLIPWYLILMKRLKASIPEAPEEA